MCIIGVAVGVGSLAGKADVGVDAGIGEDSPTTEAGGMSAGAGVETGAHPASATTNAPTRTVLTRPTKPAIVDILRILYLLC